MNHLNKKLFEAVQGGSTKLCEQLIISGADVQARDSEGWTPLYWSVRGGYTGIMSFLIDHGADVNSRSNDGETTLHWAAWMGHTGAALLLLDHGLDVNANDKDGKTPLHRASLLGKTDLVLALLDRAADVNAKDNDGFTSVHQAATGDRNETALALIAYHANTTYAKEEHRHLTAQQAAAMGGFSQRLMALLNENPSNKPGDEPEALIRLAMDHDKPDTAAVLQSHLAREAIEAIDVLMAKSGRRLMS